MPKATNREHLTITIGGDAQPFMNVMKEISAKTQQLASGVAGAVGAGGLLSAGGVGSLGINTILENDIAESFEAAKILSPEGKGVGLPRVIRGMDEAFKATGVSWESGEFAQMAMGLRRAADQASMGSKGVIRNLQFAGFDVSNIDAIRRLQEGPSTELASYILGGAQSQYQRTHPGFYRSALDALGMTKIHHAMKFGLDREAQRTLAMDETASFADAQRVHVAKRAAARAQTDIDRFGQSVTSTVLGEDYGDTASSIFEWISQGLLWGGGGTGVGLLGKGAFKLAGKGRDQIKRLKNWRANRKLEKEELIPQQHSDVPFGPPLPPRPPYSLTGSPHLPSTPSPVARGLADDVGGMSSLNPTAKHYRSVDTSQVWKGGPVREKITVHDKKLRTLPNE